MTPATIKIRRNETGRVTITAPAWLWDRAGIAPADNAVVSQQFSPDDKPGKTVGGLMKALDGGGK